MLLETVQIAKNDLRKYGKKRLQIYHIFANFVTQKKNPQDKPYTQAQLTSWQSCELLYD